MTSGRFIRFFVLAVILLAAVAPAQQNLSPPQVSRPQTAPPSPVPPATAPQTGAPAAPKRPGDISGFRLENVSLAEFIDIVARSLKINYLVDPKFKNGSVTIHTYGEVKTTDLMSLLETVLHVNGAALVKVGDLYRVVPMDKVSQMPVPPVVNGKDFPDDERMSLNLIFLKYATAAEVMKLIQPFLGEGAAAATYDPANLLILQDNNRNMKRTMELLALFDSDSFVNQRVRLYDVTNGRPSELAKQLESIFKAFSLTDKNTVVKFVPIDRINTIIAVAGNPGVFDEISTWLKKLDVPVKAPAGATDNYVYRLKYGRAETMAMALMALYSGNPMALMQLAQMNSNQVNMGVGFVGTPALGGFGGGGYGGAGAGYNGGGFGGAGGFGTSGYGGFGGNSFGGLSSTSYGNAGYGGYGGYRQPSASMGLSPFGAAPGGQTAGTPDQTGNYLGNGPEGSNNTQRIPHIIPNPFDNTLLVQCTPEDWEQISRLVAQLDVPPRQILIDAKILEVQLTGSLQYGLESYLQNLSTSVPSGFTGAGQPGGFLGSLLSSGGLTLTGGLLIGHSRQLLGALNALESTGKTKLVSEPSLIATDSIPATMNVGESVPTLSSSVASGVESGGTTLFANNISNVGTGVTLNIMARANSSGIITMMINQQVSAPVPPASGAAIQSDSFTNRSFQTQITVQDGDTIGIGGFIGETVTDGSSGLPFLQRIPVLGAVFGNKTHSTSRDELIVFFTPHVIYDTTSVAEATDDLKNQLKHLKNEMKGN